MNPISKTSIFQSTTCLNKEQLLLYTKNQLSPSQKHEVELHLVDCELCTDALEGYQLLAGPVVVEETLNLVKKLTEKKTHSVSPDHMKLMLAAASLVFIIGITLWIFHKLYEPSAVNRIRAEKVVSPQIKVTAKIPEAKFSAERTLQNDREKKNEYYTPRKEVSLNTIKSEEKEAGENLQANTSGNKMVETEELNADVAPAQTVTMEQPAAAMESGYQAESKAIPAFKKREDLTLQEKKVNEVRYINGLKTIIPVEKMNSDDSLWIVSKQGVEARYENSKAMLADKNKELSEGKTIAYTDYIEKGIHFFKQQDFVNALTVFNQVLKTREKDPNALFYGALCYDKLNNLKMAEKYLSMVTTDKAGVFYDEGMWNLALIYLKQKNTNDATRLLNEIKNQKGFYSLKASQKLEEIR